MAYAAETGLGSVGKVMDHLTRRKVIRTAVTALKERVKWPREMACWDRPAVLDQNTHQLTVAFRRIWGTHHFLKQ